MARAFGGRVLLRIEDHDRIRSRFEFEAAILEDLAWLGLSPDEPFARQRDRQEGYRRALHDLDVAGLVYPCACSRRSIEAASGSAIGEPRYPGTCRHQSVDGTVEKARRVRFERAPQVFHDLRLGSMEQVPSEQAGDILIRDRHGQWTYQFAVTVDDLDQGIDLVIRGEDLMTSTGRQIQLSHLLGRKTPPLFLHHPLIAHPDGRKLSKSDGETGLRELRASGWTVERLLGRAGFALGLTKGEPLPFSELVARMRDSAGHVV
jgi:glutamyl-tRNA synthetase/glutamyl-Q tRNA(Asp) synthetase